METYRLLNTWNDLEPQYSPFPWLQGRCACLCTFVCVCVHEVLYVFCTFYMHFFLNWNTAGVHTDGARLLAYWNIVRSLYWRFVRDALLFVHAVAPGPQRSFASDDSHVLHVPPAVHTNNRQMWIWLIWRRLQHAEAYVRIYTELHAGERWWRGLTG